MSKILYFSADWCNPCKAMRPIIEKFEREHSDVSVNKIDADENHIIVSKYEVKSIPTFILVDENDEEIRRVRGAISESDFNLFVYGE